MIDLASYDRFPAIPVTDHPDECWHTWEGICRQLNQTIQRGSFDKDRFVVAIECYTGVFEQEIEQALRRYLCAHHLFHSQDAFKTPDEIDRLVEPFLGGQDPLFGCYTHLTLSDFLDSSRLDALRRRLCGTRGVVVLLGPAAMLCCDPDLIVCADMPRWKGQLRQRRNEVSNLGVDNQSLKASMKYKRSFFVDWRVCDRLKAATIGGWHYLLDTTVPGSPKLVSGDALRAALKSIARRPFRLCPFFDPSPWGGQWMKKQFGLNPAETNYGWGFDCVPEENSLLLDFAGIRVEIPAVDLVYFCPRQLLGDRVYKRFGAEFPIRFDLLDTVAGGNLSLQVHPTADFAKDHFGLSYTQDESYYILHADEQAAVFLGLKNGVDSEQMLHALTQADAGREPFDTDLFVTKWPARKHDHFLIPAGTVHCSGKGTVVLEISATPYIFTFKLWDWGRLGLDGAPRPTNLSRGRSVIQWNRDQSWVASHLLNKTEPLEKGDGWRSERTGLHPLQFIETHRHWFTASVPHQTHGTVNVLNLVQGNAAIVQSPTGAFPPFEVHYAETFIVPAAVGRYVIHPARATSSELATIKAFIRCPPSA